MVAEGKTYVSNLPLVPGLPASLQLRSQNLIVYQQQLLVLLHPTKVAKIVGSVAIHLQKLEKNARNKNT